MKFHLKKLVDDRTREVSAYVKKGDRIIDIGSGGCQVSEWLMSQGFDVTPIDISNKSFLGKVKPIIYDGKRIPFADNSFDVALLLTILHHTKDPVSILREAKRVAKRIIVKEDLYKGIIQKYMTFAMDSAINKEFKGHPHTNKTKEEWLRVFKDLELTVLDQKENNFWVFFRNGVFYLRK
ncbi:MAG: class I SAM-dependent methyltransferase [bacterium]